MKTNQPLRLETPVDRTHMPAGLDLARICYWKNAGGVWFLYLPGGGIGHLSDHEVTEHDDGTITVSPSILVTAPGLEKVRRHGFLRRGVWEPCGDDAPPPPPDERVG